MVQKVLSLKDEDLSPSDCDSHPEEKEISDDDDDDRNHKHRRRDTQSQSMEKDSVDQFLSRPNRKRNKPFENSNPFRDNDSQTSEPWKKRSNGDNQRFPANFGHGRGRGKDINTWMHHNPRFNPAMPSQMALPGPIPPNMGPPWGPYGLIPGVLNGGLDPIHALGLQGGLRPSINMPQNMGMMRQRCRDFEERGFCLRGDMCPMEHGVNRIVVEDVQSLSQFNLPVSLPSGHALGSSSALPSINASNTMMNSNSLHSRNNKPEITDGGLKNGVSTTSGSADASDFYDPDQPLWAKDCPGSSTSFQGLNLSKFNETEFGDTRIEHHDKNNTPGVGPQATTAVWGRVGSKNKSETKGRFESSLSSSHSDPIKEKNSRDTLGTFEHATPEGKMTLDATQPINRKPAQKAFRTLFVKSIPKKDNNVEALLSHFKKFGEVIDIYIPQIGDQAFVQFSKKEEAEGALKAPDAVLGNRFIKVLWAVRDRITEDVPSTGNCGNVAPPSHNFTQKGNDNLRPAALKSSFPYTSVSHVPYIDSPKPVVQKKPGNSALLEEFRKRQESFNQKRDALQRELAKLEKKAAGSKGEAASEHVAKRQKIGAVSVSAKSEASGDTGTKMASPQEETVSDSAKTEALFLNDSGTEIVSPQTEAVADCAKVEALCFSDSGPKLTSSQEEKAGQENPVETIVDQNPLKPLTKVDTHNKYPRKTVESHELPSLKQSIRPLAPPGGQFGLNRYKLDNRPSAFRLSPPLPTGLENIDALKEHFSAFGELSSVELEDGNSSDSTAHINYSALIRFTNRRSAEKAFVSGKCWQGHTLQFVWIASSHSSNENSNKETPPKSEISTTTSAESGNLGTKNNNGECVLKGEDLRSSSSSVSGEL